MQSKVTTAADLLALFEAKAMAPPPESSQMLVRHLQCKESLALTEAVAAAITRNNRQDTRTLAVPSEILPPLL